MYVTRTTADLLTRFEAVGAFNTHLELTRELDRQLTGLAHHLKACSYAVQEAFKAIRSVAETVSTYMRDHLLSTEGRRVLDLATGLWAVGGVSPKAGSFHVDPGHYVCLAYDSSARLLNQLHWNERLYGREQHMLGWAAAQFHMPQEGVGQEQAGRLTVKSDTPPEFLAEEDPFECMEELFKVLRLIAPQCRAERSPAQLNHSF